MHPGGPPPWKGRDCHLLGYTCTFQRSAKLRHNPRASLTRTFAHKISGATIKTFHTFVSRNFLILIRDTVSSRNSSNPAGRISEVFSFPLISSSTVARKCPGTGIELGSGSSELPRCSALPLSRPALEFSPPSDFYPLLLLLLPTSLVTRGTQLDSFDGSTRVSCAPLAPVWNRLAQHLHGDPRNGTSPNHILLRRRSQSAVIAHHREACAFSPPGCGNGWSVGRPRGRR